MLIQSHSLWSLISNLQFPRRQKISPRAALRESNCCNRVVVQAAVNMRVLFRRVVILDFRFDLFRFDVQIDVRTALIAVQTVCDARHFVRALGAVNKAILRECFGQVHRVLELAFVKAFGYEMINNHGQQKTLIPIGTRVVKILPRYHPF